MGRISATIRTNSYSLHDIKSCRVAYGYLFIDTIRNIDSLFVDDSDLLLTSDLCPLRYVRLC